MMSSLSMVESKLPPGFRFHPRDEELVCDYLMKKISCSEQQPPFLVEVDLNKSEPWEIPEESKSPIISGLSDDWVLCRVFHKSKEIGTTKLHGVGSISGSYQQEDDNKPYSNFSSLPPLMEQPYITFEQPQAINNNNDENLTITNNDHFQQVPCFSIFSSHQTSQPFSQINTNTIFPNDNNAPFFGGLMLPENNNNANYSISSSSSCGNNNEHVLKAVLEHLTKIETNNNNNAYMKDQSPASFGEGSSESLLSEIGLPSSSVWNHQY
ncbi:hypothetical protein Leryth_007874 [Lithospermum erythrorhizon]|nr:hypothetical protein Leryth_007874 [Lithospermum erythrorhizon]